MQRIQPTFVQGLAFGGVLTLVLSCGLYYYVLHTIQENRTEVLIAQEEQLIRDARKREADTARTLVEETQFQREELTNYFVNTEEEEVIVFLDSLESLGPMVGAEYVTETVGVAEGDRESTDSIPVTGVRSVALVSGSWAQLYQLITLIEHMPYALTITKVALEQSDDDPRFWEGQLHVHVQAK